MEYIKLADLFKRLEAFTEKSVKTTLLSRFILNIPDDKLNIVMLLIQGKVFHPWEEKKIGVGEKLVMRSISLATGYSKDVVEKLFVKYGDLGLVAHDLLSRRKQKPLFKKTLTVDDIYITLKKIAELEGEGTIDKKVKLLSDILVHAEPLEGKYIVRTILEDLKIGVAEGIIIESIAKAYGLIPDDVEYAFSILHDFGKVVYIIRNQGKSALKSVKPEVGVPIRVMLAVKAESIEEAFEIVGRPAQLEYKYDGFRVQVHKKGDKIILWTRRLENVTDQFPDIVSYLRKALPNKDYIIEGEIVGYDRENQKFLPFQNISQRIKRKYDISKMIEEVPVEIHLFDIIYYDGNVLIDKKFEERRKILESIVSEKEGEVMLSRAIITSNNDEAQRFFESSIERGLEGVVFKNLHAIYRPGRRVGYMVKLKPVRESLDVVVVGGEWGEGKRAGWITSLIIAVRDPSTGEFLEIGEVGSGLKEKKEHPDDVTFEEITNMLKTLIIKQEGKIVRVKPQIVIEVLYDEIQKSPKYSSGYALRFPRFVRLRLDRGPSDIDTIERIEELYKKQHS